MYSTSTGLACCASRFACCAACHASAPASGPIGALMLGPHAKAIAPPADGALRIQPRRLAEGVDRAVVVEAVGEREPLIEVALGILALGGDRMVDLAEPVEEPRHAALRLARRMARLAGAEDGGDRQQTDRTRFAKRGMAETSRRHATSNAASL